MKNYNYADIIKDYNALIDKWGDPSDMTGGFVDGDKFRELLQCPTKQKAASIIKSIIDYGFQDRNGCYNSEREGFINRNDCEVVDRIYTKYYEDLDY